MTEDGDDRNSWRSLRPFDFAQDRLWRENGFGLILRAVGGPCGDDSRKTKPIPGGGTAGKVGRGRPTYEELPVAASSSAMEAQTLSSETNPIAVAMPIGRSAFPEGPAYKQTQFHRGHFGW